jgi:acyl-CoA dehydrogenase
MLPILIVALALVLAVLCLYAGRAYWAWVAPGILLLGLMVWRNLGSSVLHLALAIPFVLLALVFGLPPLRRALVSGRLLRLMAPIFPRMSDTERIALEAGTVWWDAELFSGAPDWKRLIDFQCKPLSDDEQRFLDGPVEELCRMVDDHDVHQRGDLTPETWAFIKRQKLMGMIIPKEFGGLGFSAIANSAVVTKLSSRSVTASVTVMVPNSLGPAELLLHYGTDAQKKHYLPRLAVGDEVPCFALTEPHAGSDAGGMRSKGVVCRGTFEGQEQLGMRLDWEKRYATLAPVATLIGLAFRLFDPDHLLGDREDLGITCALIPTSVKGVEHGARHNPLSIPFMNGTTRGKSVFVPLDFIIGGPKMAGQGWRMLMECLSAGRSISLPANSVGGSQLCTRVIGAYASVREQFNLAIGRFEGIEQPLARIGGTMYWLNALRVLTAGAVDSGEKPAVISAIAKRWSTEAMRRVVNDAMDIQGGAGISKGRRNMLAAPYQAVPIGITVEGANILTRTMIIFGQGAIRCHPYALKEMEAAAARDIAKFDAAFFGHMGFVFQNGTRALLYGVFGAGLAHAPADRKIGSRSARLLRDVSRMSAAFALTSDLCMGTLGGNLKRKEMISGRLADALAWMYVASATVKKFVDEGELERDRPFAEWAAREALFETQEAIGGVIENLPNRPAAALLRVLIFPLGKPHTPPNDRLSSKVARALLDGGEARVALTRDMHLPKEESSGLARLERALALTIASEPSRKKLRDAVKAKTLPRGTELEIVDEAVTKNVIGAAERVQLLDAARARNDAIQVDEFSADEFATLRG